ncbi:MFS transporter [Halalkalibacter sp. AB-rgal2]|uniref:MFS transporter n=1 Tax=Halalkalibacter sp. AB-rgal2 TaxID=3242695 RepID=UPI00359E17E0
MNTQSAPTFSYKKIAAIGSGFFALTMIWTFYNAYMPLILGNFIESRAIRGAIMGLDNLLAVLLIPLIGSWSDRLQSPLGNRLPFIIVGMPIAAIFFILIPYSATVTLWLLLIIDIIFLLAMTIYRAPVIALMPDHTHPSKRSTANGVINLMGGIGAIIALFVLSNLFVINRAFPFIVAGIFLILSFILLYYIVDRKPAYSNRSNDSLEETQASLSFTHSLLKLKEKQYRGQLLILIAIFLYFIGYSGMEAQFTVYAVEYLQLDENVAGMTLGFFSLSFVLFAIPAGILGSKLGKAPTMFIGLIALPLLFILIPLLPLFVSDNSSHSFILILQAVLFLSGIAWAFINVQAYPLVADLGGVHRIGFFTGLYYLFSMASSIIAPGLLGLFMDLIGHSSLFYCAAFTFIIAFYFLRKGHIIISSQHDNQPMTNTDLQG